MNDLDEKPIRRNDLRKERWAILGVVLLLLGAVAVPQAFRKKHALPVDDGPPLEVSQADQFRGMTLQLHSYWDGIPFEKYVEQIARTGANTICFSLAAYQENCASNSLFIEYRKVPSEQRLEKLIKLAHDRGLRVVLMPIILLEKPRGGEWRGKINPPDPDHWWKHYERYILFYARIAEKTGAEMFMIGSELVGLEDKTKRWRQLIRKVRKAYKGQLSYSANWDHYKDIEWWRDLDLIGMTVYYDLVGDKEPTLKVLLEAWKPIKKEILAWQRKVRLPIIFTEVGWPNQEGCAKEPWNYYNNPDKPDPTAQANCFEAFFATWQGEKTVAGILVWEWQNHPDQTGGPKDTSYIPKGKPAMKIIRRYYLSPGPSSRTAPAATKPARRPD